MSRSLKVRRIHLLPHAVLEGIIDYKLVLVIPTEYSLACSFHRELIVAKQDSFANKLGPPTL